ncbi:Nucleoporin nup84, partial [Coemansia thaxteri]
MSNTPLLTEYVEVRRWLEETARPFQPVETRKGYLFYTRRSIAERGLLPSSVQKGSSIAERIVTEADPDAASRQRRELVLEDAEYEAGLIRTLYEYVRRGRVANAMDLCIESDEPWRAATLKGGLFWRDPTLEVGNGVLVEDESGERMQDVRPLHTAGNINRTLWKQACAALAHDENNDLYERALYAALSGRLDEVVLVCECWEDYLWAYVNTMIETRIDCGIKDTSLLYTPAQGTSLSNVQSKHPPIRDMQHVFQVLATHDSAAVRRESSLPFHRLQTAIIVNSFPDYISDYAQRLRAKSLSDGECDLLRFVVHTALHLRQLGFALPAEPVNVVLENYIIHLSKSHRELVAIY